MAIVHIILKLSTVFQQLCIMSKATLKKCEILEWLNLINVFFSLFFFSLICSLTGHVSLHYIFDCLDLTASI